jgi:hypothetical protein
MGRVTKEIKEQRLKDAASDLNEALEEAYPVLYDAMCYLPKQEQKQQARAAYDKAKLALYKAFKG